MGKGVKSRAAYTWEKVGGVVEVSPGLSVKGVIRESETKRGSAEGVKKK